MRRELGGIDEDAGAALVGDGGQPLQRQHLAGDIGRAGHREQRGGLAAQLGDEPADGLLDRRPGLHDAAAVLGPGQEVRVVLDIEHHGVTGHAGREQVQRVGGVAGEHHHLIVGRVEEPGDRTAGRLVALGGDPRRVARAAVHARVERQQLLYPVGDLRQCGRAGGVVEVGVGGRPALDERHLKVVAGNPGKGGTVLGHHSSHHENPIGSGTRNQVIRRVRACRTRSGVGLVVTRSTPPRRRVADQQAGAERWYS
ncbi:hypothetical protein NONI108955_43310 [Nocardia ninae]